MKLTVFLLLVSVAGVLANKSYSQTKMLNLNMREATVKEVLKSIEEQSEFHFLYSENLINVERKVNLTIENKKIEQVLNLIFEGTDVDYSIRDRFIVLTTTEVHTEELDVLQQEITISGRVTDSSGAPLPGVTVIIKGTTKGTITDNNGSYSLSNVAGDAVLVFSFVGMKTKEIEVKGKNSINVVLEEDAVGIEEVVAIGYGTTKKRDLIGSVASVNGEDLIQTQSSSFIDVLQGRASGVYVATTSGSPGSEVNLKVRGYHSINLGSDPLYIIDGMPVVSSDVGLTDGTNKQSIMATINPNDIESIEILKDAAATAIYGSRGSNGVVLISTKKGKAKEGGSIQVDYSSGFSHLAKPMEKFDFVNTKEWFEMADMSLAHTNNPDRIFDVTWRLSSSYYKKKLTREEAESINTNWFDYVLRTGTYNDINIAFKQGFEKGSVYTSLSYRNDKSVSVGNDMERLSARINADFSPVKNLEWSTRLNLSYIDNNRVKSRSHRTLGYSDGAYGGFGVVTRFGMPWLRAYDVEDPTGYWNPTAGNYAMASDRKYFLDQKQTYRGLGGSSLVYRVSGVKGLSLCTSADVDAIIDNTNMWTSAKVSNNGVSTGRNEIVSSISVNYNAYLNYNRTFNEVHNIAVVMGTESQRSKIKFSDMQGTGLIGVNEEIGSTSPTTMLSMVSYTGGERYIRSYFARADYKFMDKYLLGLSARRDGSSVFDPEYRWGTFYAFSAGWIISDENFFRGFKDTFSLLKLRGSFGQTGNQNVGNDANITTINYKSDYRYGMADYIAAGAYYSVGNKAMTWETTDSYDAGVDFGLFNNRISGSLAYYMQDVSGLLLAVSTPPSAAIGSVYGNVGSMKNWGYEFNLSSTNIKKEDFSWATNFNISYNKNEITNLTDEMEAAKGSTTFVGGRLGLWKKCDYAGIDQERGVYMIWEYDATEYSKTGKYVRTGRKIPYTYTNAAISSNQLVHKDKSSIPTFYGGINNTLKFKGFELSAFFTFSGGNYMYNFSEREWTIAQSGSNLWKKEAITKSWKPEWTEKQKAHAKYQLLAAEGAFPYYTSWNTSATDPNYPNLKGYWTNPDIDNPVKATATENYEKPNRGQGTQSDGLTKYLEKADYLRLKTLTLRYNIQRNLISKIGIQNASVYISGTNIWTLTNYSGFDPEVDDNSELLPSVKMYSIGINMTF